MSKRPRLSARLRRQLFDLIAPRSMQGMLATGLLAIAEESARLALEDSALRADDRASKRRR